MTNERFDELPRRRVLAATVSTALGVGVAGCSEDSGDGDAADDDDDDDDGNSSDTTMNSPDGGNMGGQTGGAGGDLTEGMKAIDVAGAVASNSVDGIDVISTEAYEAVDFGMAGEGAFLLLVTVENTGSEKTETLGPTYELSLFDANGSELNDGWNAQAFHRELAPGETGTFVTWGSWGTMADDVARYELAVNCDGTLADGPYCE